MAHDAAAKGGVITLTKSLANEYAPHGITVNNIAAAAGFLCSDEAGFITGQVLGVNGGAVM